MKYVIEERDAGRTVKDYLRDVGVSSRLLRQLKAAPQGITLNGSHVTVRALLSPGDVLSIETKDTPLMQATQDAPSLPPILYEDDCVIVFDKPAGMPTHPSFRHRGDTLADAVLAMPGAPAVFRAINRLDKDTSGIVLVARNQLVASKLSSAMARGEIQKEYLALVDHPLDPPSGLMTDYIAREGDSIIRRTTVPTGQGDYAETAYETVDVRGDYALLRLVPRTGRTHQLRVQLSSRSSPIMGDDLYGGTPALPRQALHATCLRFPHPFKGDIVIESDLPEDMFRIFYKENL